MDAAPAAALPIIFQASAFAPRAPFRARVTDTVDISAQDRNGPGAPAMVAAASYMVASRSTRVSLPPTAAICREVGSPSRERPVGTLTAQRERKLAAAFPSSLRQKKRISLSSSSFRRRNSHTILQNVQVKAAAAVTPPLCVFEKNERLKRAKKECSKSARLSLILLSEIIELTRSIFYQKPFIYFLGF